MILKTWGVGKEEKITFDHCFLLLFVILEELEKSPAFIIWYLGGVGRMASDPEGGPMQVVQKKELIMQKRGTILKAG